MAKVGEEELDYDSDPEEEKRMMVRRRREAASDDEEGEGEEKERVDRRGAIHSDESDGQGGVAEYDEDEEELDGEAEDDGVYEDVEEEEEVYDEEEGDGEEEGVDGFGGRKEGNVARGVGIGGHGIGDKEKVEVGVEGRKGEDRVETRGVASHEEEGGGGEGEGEEEGEGVKKENEPFAVPTAGAFYMHDDRFRDNAGGRHRRTFGGRRLWESKDDKKWGHDKFEEMTLQERHYEQGRRTSKGHYQARGGKNRGPGRGYGRGNRSRAFSNGNNESQVPKTVRGRGPRRYEHTMKNSSQTIPTQRKQPGKPPEKTSHSSSGRTFTPASNAESDKVPPAKRHSSLSSASPPFYPSGSSNKDITLTQKRNVTGVANRNLHSPVIEESFSNQQHNVVTRGKNKADSVGIDKLYIDDSINPATGKPLNKMQMGSSLVNTVQSSQSKAQGKGVVLSGQMTYQPMLPNNQVGRVPSSAKLHGVQQSPAQNQVSPSVQAPGQQVGQRSGSGSQASPPKTPVSTNSYETGELDGASESSKSKNALVVKGKGSIQGSGRGSFLYGGAQVMGVTGNMSIGHGDQNFPGTPAFLPVMPFGGQHPGGMGVPALGMAFPGYVAQPQPGVGNSEMTWLPLLAGTAGALGATCGSPYIPVDGAYHAQPSGQSSLMGPSSKETNNNKPNNEWKRLSQRPEPVSDEFGQRQKPRRYSEMDFKQPSTSA